MIKEVIKFVDDAFEHGVNKKNSTHSAGTLQWVRKLKADADEAMLIAAYAHDIARAFTKTDTLNRFRYKEFNDSGYLKEHQEQSAKIISDFLKEKKFDPLAVTRVESMVRKHEVGGDAESNLIKDADSISYFEQSAMFHIRLAPALGKEKIRRKLTWMYERISSPQAKKFADPLYKKAISVLDMN